MDHGDMYGEAEEDCLQRTGTCAQPHYTFGDAVNKLTFDLSHLSGYFHNASVSNVVARPHLSHAPHTLTEQKLSQSHTTLTIRNGI